MSKSKRMLMVWSVGTPFLGGCYVVQVVDPERPVQNWHYALPPTGIAVAAGQGGHPVAPSGGSLPTVLNARLYPDNDLATQTGVVTGTVANMMNGKGRFQIQYGSEILTGEATRVS